MSPLISVIIPVGPGEESLQQLLSDLQSAPTKIEVIIVKSEEVEQKLELAAADRKCRVLSASSGRASQMNAGAKSAAGEFLLFLHADSRIERRAWDALFDSIEHYPGCLHYFELSFQNDGPILMKLNAWGVWFRSHWLKIPFGDQGLCVSGELFDRVGGFDTSVPYGEDHVFVWTARLHRIRLRCTGATLQTSARKYRQRGWLRTTMRHVYLTVRQALPFWWRLVRRKWLA